MFGINSLFYLVDFQADFSGIQGAVKNWDLSWLNVGLVIQKA